MTMKRKYYQPNDWDNQLTNVETTKVNWTANYLEFIKGFREKFTTHPYFTEELMNELYNEQCGSSKLQSWRKEQQNLQDTISALCTLEGQREILNRLFISDLKELELKLEMEVETNE